ncbi:DUF6941 family protein [Priestia flexa]|uniref:DUF6941 family protein n=1 Tax=Priestia flexa TaxID=86664 RepID=UPI0013D6CC96|nr:hypothetical protein [Priestia flexa]
MAKISSIIVSEDTFNNENEMIIKNPYTIITPYAVPGNFSFVLTFSMIELQPGTSYSLEINIQNPHGENIREPGIIDFDYQPSPEEKTRSRDSASLSLNFKNVVFKEEGLHTFYVELKGHNRKELEIPVFSLVQ